MGQKKILYFECSSGISGDMALGALLDLGVDREKFLAELEKLHLEGYRIEFEKAERNAIRANYVKVVLTEPGNEHNTALQHGHGHVHKHHKGYQCGHAQDLHDWEQALSHHHEHRSFHEIRELIGGSGLSAEVKELALRIFTRVAAAEAKVHGKSMEDVHFHEVGAVDSIVDIVGCAVLVCMIKPDRICASVVQDGHGFVACQHGLLSVPVPAVSEIFAASDAVLRQIDIETELVTPTGAAIITELAESYGMMPEMKIEKIGWGAGTKILPVPNVLKVYLGNREEDSAQPVLRDEIIVMETNLDDCTGEMLGYAMEKLLAAGALDVFYTPIFMKKNRPAYKLTVLAKPEDTEKMETLIFRHTTTIGIRRRREMRSILRREKDVVQTSYGELEVKRVIWEDNERRYPEYESAVKLAEKNHVPLRQIYLGAEEKE